MCSLAGLLAGCMGASLGLGGGIVLLPIWISMGIPSTVASSSSSFLIIWNSITSIIQVALEGFYDLTIVVALLVAGLVGPLIGIKIMECFVGNNSRGVLIVLLFVVAGSGVVLIVKSLIDWSRNAADFVEWGFIC